MNRYVLVRTYSAGVHFGYLQAVEGMGVILSNARRLWCWDNAFTLSKVSTEGVGKNSKISCKVAEIALSEAIEIIPMEERARVCLENYPEYK